MIDFLSQYRLEGLFIGLCTFLIIGLFHPLVIKGEYYFGEKVKWWFLIGGIISCSFFGCGGCDRFRSFGSDSIQLFLEHKRGVGTSGASSQGMVPCESCKSTQG